MSGGQQVSIQQGTLTFNRAGLTVAIQQGTLVAFGNNIDVVLSGQEVEISSGSVVIGGSSIIGQQISSAQGSFTSTRSVELTGIGISAIIGSVVPGIDADDTYVQLQQGQPVAVISRDLVGQQVSTAVGNLIYTLADLTGQQVTLAQGEFVKQTRVDLVGQSINVDFGFIESSGGIPAEQVASGGWPDYRVPRRRKLTETEIIEEIEKIPEVKQVIRKAEVPSESGKGSRPLNAIERLLVVKSAAMDKPSPPRLAPIVQEVRDVIEEQDQSDLMDILKIFW